MSLWKVGPETGYRYDIAALEKLITPRTKVIVVNTPHNPTGAMLAPADAKRVYELATSVGATVIGDEAYRWLAVPDGEPFAPPFFDFGESAVSVGDAVETIRIAGFADRMDCRPAGSHSEVLEPSRLHHAQSRQAERCAGAARHDAPRPDYRAQYRDHPGEYRGSRGVGSQSGPISPGRRRAVGCWRCSSTTCRWIRYLSPTNWPQSSA
jgi:hypothetical protein